VSTGLGVVIVVSDAFSMLVVAAQIAAVCRQNSVRWQIQAVNVVVGTDAYAIKSGPMISFLIGFLAFLNAFFGSRCSLGLEILNDAHLRRLIRDYISYYHADRIHDSLEKDTPAMRPVSSKPGPAARLVSLPGIGGLHHRYDWQQAA